MIANTLMQAYKAEFHEGRAKCGGKVALDSDVLRDTLMARAVNIERTRYGGFMYVFSDASYIERQSDKFRPGLDYRTRTDAPPSERCEGTLEQLSADTGESVQTLINWSKNKPVVFELVLRGLKK